ncbi:hypothetical protein Tco_1223046, partial [Tanacetum coccineum]
MIHHSQVSFLLIESRRLLHPPLSLGRVKKTFDRVKKTFVSSLDRVKKTREDAKVFLNRSKETIPVSDANESAHKREDFQLFEECGILTVNPYHFDTNPPKEGEIPRYSKGIEEVEFRIKAESFKQVNDDNTA